MLKMYTLWMDKRIEFLDHTYMENLDGTLQLESW